MASTDKLSMQTKRGSTGLTQKEAIFRVFKKVLGPQFKPGMNVHTLICVKSNVVYGRATWDSSHLNRIVLDIYEGLKDGSIPSKLNSNSEGYSASHFEKLRHDYANRIAHYWMKHDKRLNGGQVATRMAKSKRKQIVLLDRVKTDPTMNSLRAFLQTMTSPEDRSEVQRYISGRIFEIILETFSINFKEIPQVILDEMGISLSELNPTANKEAA